MDADAPFVGKFIESAPPIVKDYGHKSVLNEIGDMYERSFIEREPGSSLPLQQPKSDVLSQKVIDTTDITKIIDETFRQKFSSDAFDHKNDSFFQNFDTDIIKRALNEHFIQKENNKCEKVKAQSGSAQQSGINSTDTLEKVIGGLFNQQNAKETNAVNSFIKQVQQRINNVAAAHQNVNSDKNELQKVISDIIGVKVSKDPVPAQPANDSSSTSKVSDSTVSQEKCSDDKTQQNTHDNVVASRGFPNKSKNPIMFPDGSTAPPVLPDNFDKVKDTQRISEDRFPYRRHYEYGEHGKINNDRVTHDRMRGNSYSPRGRDDRGGRRDYDDSIGHQRFGDGVQPRRKDDWTSRVQEFIDEKRDKRISDRYYRHDARLPEKNRKKGNTDRRRRSRSSSTSSSSNSSSSSSRSSSSSSSSSSSGHSMKKSSSSYKRKNSKPSEAKPIKTDKISNPEHSAEKSIKSDEKSFLEALAKKSSNSDKKCGDELCTQKLNKDDVKFEEINPDDLEPDDIDSLLSSYLQPKGSSDGQENLSAKLQALPAKSFLQVVLKKLDNLELKGMEELNMLTQIVIKAQVLLCKKLPPRFQAALMQKMAQSKKTQISPALSTVQEIPLIPSLPDSPNNSDILCRVPVSNAKQTEQTLLGSSTSVGSVSTSTANKNPLNVDPHMMIPAFRQMLLSYFQAAKLSQLGKPSLNTNQSQLSASAAALIPANLLQSAANPNGLNSMISHLNNSSLNFLSSNQPQNPVVPPTSTTESTSEKGASSLTETKQSSIARFAKQNTSSSESRHSPVIQEKWPNSISSSLRKHSPVIQESNPNSAYLSARRRSPISQEVKSSFSSGTRHSSMTQHEKLSSSSLSGAIHSSVTHHAKPSLSSSSGARHSSNAQSSKISSSSSSRERDSPVTQHAKSSLSSSSSKIHSPDIQQGKLSSSSASINKHSAITPIVNPSSSSTSEGHSLVTKQAKPLFSFEIKRSVNNQTKLNLSTSSSSKEWEDFFIK